MGSEKLGTCDRAKGNYLHPHYLGCVNWREQPQEMTKPLRFYVRKKSYKTTRGGIVSVYQVLTNIGKGSTRAKTICAYLNKMAMKF